MKKNKKNNAKTPVSGSAAVIFSIPRGLLTALISAAVLTLAASFAVFCLPNPGNAVMPAGLAVFYISSAAAGFAAYKKSRSYTLLTGFFCGLALTAAALIASLAIPLSYSPGLTPGGVFLTRLPAVPAAIAGAFAASAEPRKRRKKRR